MENVVPPMGTIFFWVGTKTMQKHTHNVESVEIPFVVWGQNKWECKSRIVTHNGLMFFFEFVGITTYRYLGFSNYLPHLSGLDMKVDF